MARNNAQRQAALAQSGGNTESETNTETTAPETGETVNEHATTGGASETVPKGPSKSIVPAKYSGKYKNGGSDPLAMFIKEVCGEGDKFEFSAFFALCRANLGGSLTEEQVAKYESQVADKTQGANGRARMTLRNMLATKVRKEGKLVDLAGNTRELSLPKPAVSGAAAAAQANAANNAGETATTETEQTGDDAGGQAEEAQTE